MLKTPMAAGAIAALATFLAAPDAAAVEHEHAVGFGAGLSLLKVNDKSALDVGGGVAAFYSYGITDQFNFLAEGGSSIVALNEKVIDSTTPKTLPSIVSFAAVGLSYVLDIVQWVPYFGALGGVTYLAGGTMDSGLFLPDAQIAVGLDYKLSPKLSLGVAGRQHFFFTKMDLYPSYTTVYARVQYSWGW